jgi:hypothetical protein
MFAHFLELEIQIGTADKAMGDYRVAARLDDGSFFGPANVRGDHRPLLAAARDPATYGTTLFKAG